MSFTKVTAPSMTVANITALADRPALTSAAIKAKFDEAGGDLLVYLTSLSGEVNALIDALEASAAAASLGAVKLFPDDEAYTEFGENVQEQLAALKEYIRLRIIAAGAGDMLESEYVDAGGTGKVLAAANSDKLGGALPSAYALALGGQAEKGSIADADTFAMSDSADSNAQKKTPWSTIKSTMQTALAFIFAAKSHGHLFADLTGAANAVHTHSYAAVDHAHTSYANLSHQHAAADLSGVVKNAAGITVTVGTEPTSPAVNDLWFSDEV